MPRIESLPKLLESAGGAQPTLLIGHGFSQSYAASVKSTFSWNEITAAAQGSLVERFPTSRAAELLNEHGPSAYEEIIAQYETCIALENKYETKIDSIIIDADNMKEILSKAVYDVHPKWDQSILLRGKEFLSQFSRIYSLNYDYVLVWAVNVKGDPSNVPVKDSIYMPFDYPPRSKKSESIGLRWVKNSQTKVRSEICYLHGALHLFEYRSGDLQNTFKLSSKHASKQMSEEGMSELVIADKKSLRNLTAEMWKRIEDSKGKLSGLTVVGGSGSSKMIKIRSSKYLQYIYDLFCEESGALVIYGASLSDSDSHLTDAMIHGKLQNIYIGIYTDDNHYTTEQNEIDMLRLSRLPLMRRKANSGGGELSIHFFDARRCSPWNADSTSPI